jgi:hypothetical protein
VLNSVMRMTKRKGRVRARHSSPLLTTRMRTTIAVTRMTKRQWRVRYSPPFLTMRTTPTIAMISVTSRMKRDGHGLRVVISTAMVMVTGAWAAHRRPHPPRKALQAAMTDACVKERSRNPVATRRRLVAVASLVVRLCLRPKWCGLQVSMTSPVVCCRLLGRSPRQPQPYSTPPPSLPTAQRTPSSVHQSE